MISFLTFPDEDGGFIEGRPTYINIRLLVKLATGYDFSHDFAHYQNIITNALQENEYTVFSIYGNIEDKYYKVSFALKSKSALAYILLGTRNSTYTNLES